MAASLSTARCGRAIPRTELKPLPAPAEQGAARSLACRHAVAVVCRNVFVGDDAVARHRLPPLRGAAPPAIRRPPPAPPPPPPPAARRRPNRPRRRVVAAGATTSLRGPVVSNE